MRSDNSIHLVTAARRRHEHTRAKAVAAMHELDRAGTPITFEAVADAAGVSSAAMIWSRLPSTWRFISASRCWPRASAAEMIWMTCCRCWWCWGRNCGVVMNIGQVRPR